MRLVNVIKTYNQEITFILFCAGIIFYGLGGSIGKNFNAQTFLYWWIDFLYM